MEFYRVEEIQYESGPRLYVRKFYLVYETPCGHWISDDPKHHAKWEFSDRIPPSEWDRWLPKKRWVSKTSRKRLAYPTLKEALHNFRARKNRQISILTHRLERAKTALAVAKGEHIETKLQRHMHQVP
jgi:hypothetical protein